MPPFSPDFAALFTNSLNPASVNGIPSFSINCLPHLAVIWTKHLPASRSVIYSLIIELNKFQALKSR